MFLLKDDFLILKKIISTDKIVLLIISSTHSKTNVTEQNISKYRWQNVFLWLLSLILIWPSIFSIASRFCHLWITLVVSCIELEDRQNDRQMFCGQAMEITLNRSSCLLIFLWIQSKYNFSSTINVSYELFILKRTDPHLHLCIKQMK